jgi:hypothetical protein
MMAGIEMKYVVTPAEMNIYHTLMPSCGPDPLELTVTLKVGRGDQARHPNLASTII